jgi:hypothetical protein
MKDARESLLNIVYECQCTAEVLHWFPWQAVEMSLMGKMGSIALEGDDDSLSCFHDVRKHGEERFAVN